MQQNQLAHFDITDTGCGPHQPNSLGVEEPKGDKVIDSTLNQQPLSVVHIKKLFEVKKKVLRQLKACLAVGQLQITEMNSLCFSTGSIVVHDFVPCFTGFCPLLLLSIHPTGSPADISLVLPIQNPVIVVCAPATSPSTASTTSLHSSRRK